MVGTVITVKELYGVKSADIQFRNGTNSTPLITSVADYKSDSDGLDLNRQTITGDNDTYFKVLIEQVEGRYLTDEEYFPQYVKAHIDRGSKLLLDMYNHAGNMDKYILQVLGEGDTV